MMSKVVVVGSLNMDIVIQVERHPHVGETIFSQSVSSIPGGKGANQAAASASQGAATHLIGRVGADDFGDALLQFCHRFCINTDAVKRVPNLPTGQAFVTVDVEGVNSVVVHGGANQSWGATFSDTELIGPGDMILAQLEIPTHIVAQAFEAAKTKGATTILNPSPVAFFDLDLLDLTDILIANEHELGTAAQAKSQPSSADDYAAAEAAAAGRACKRIITTLGELGVRIYDRGERSSVPGRRVQAVDTTGAGDCFAGTFAAALADGADFVAAAKRANLAASISVTRLGAGPSMPTRDEVDALIN